MKTLKSSILTLLAIGAGLTSSQVQGQVTLFQDAFTTDSSALWNIKAGSANAVDDYTVLYAFYYATNTYTSNGVVRTIPLAPNSTIGVATNGAKIWVNKNDAIASAAAVNLYPNLSQTFSNDYTLKFDMFLGYNGPEGGGTGSTEFGIFGLNMSGNETNWSGSTLGDGMWFGVTGEGGAARDWRTYIGDTIIPGAPLELQGLSGGFLDRDGDTVVEQERFTEPNTAPLKLMFPKPAFETDGVPGKQWVQVEIRQRTNDLGERLITWLVNGYVIATNSPNIPGGAYAALTEGNVMIGNMDPFDSIASPAADNFVIFDNVRVQDLSGVPTNEVVSVVTVDGTGGETPDDDGQLLISRTGSTASPLDVPFRMAGSATRGSDYQLKTNGVILTVNSVRIPAGSSSVTVDVDVLNDLIGEPTEQAILVLAGNPNAYDIFEGIRGVVDILDDNDLPIATVSAFRIAAYEGNTNSYGQFRVEFSNPYNLSDLTVNYTLSGTAANGTHYETLGSSVVILQGTTNSFVTVLPIQNSDTVSNRTVILTVTSGVNYTLGSTLSATNTIFNDDLVAPVGTAFSENFDTDVSASWSVNSSHVLNRATFAYDYNADGIPSAPNSGGTTIGLKVEANVNTLGPPLASGVSGVSVSPIGQSFEGDYRLRFDWWANYPGELVLGGSGSTQLGTYGLTRGTVAEWPSAPSKSDSVYFALTGDGGSGTDYRAYTNGGATLPASVMAAGAVNNTASYYAVFGNLAAPPAQLLAPNGAGQTGRTSLGAPGEVWHDVVITKLGSTLLWHMDGVLLATVNASRHGFTLSTNIFVGQSDINTGQSTLPEMLFSLYDNLRVETLPAPAVNITNTTFGGTSAILTFTGGTNDPAAAYLLQQASAVSGPYANNLSAIVTNVSPGVFRAVAVTNGTTQFYRIRR